MLAEAGRFPQNHCAGGRQSAVYEVVTVLPTMAIGLRCIRCKPNDPSQKEPRHFPQKTAQPKGA
jgi:hypothetical protein